MTIIMKIKRKQILLIYVILARLVSHKKKLHLLSTLMNLLADFYFLQSFM